MDSFGFDNVKVEKAKAMRRYNRLRNFGNFVRVLEVCVALFLLSWSSTRLPIAVKIFGSYLREFYALLLSTPFVFVIGNVIILTLVAQSGKFVGQSSEENISRNDADDEIIGHGETPQRVVTDVDSPPTQEENTIVDKYIVASENAVSSVHEEEKVVTTVSKVSTVIAVPEKASETTKPYRRTQSESFQRENRVKHQKVLCRSETERCRKRRSDGEEPARLSYAVDKLSNEEFQRTIDAFIEKQQRFLRDEYMAIVISNQH